MRTITLNRKIFSDGLTSRQIACCIGICGSDSRKVNDVVEYLYGEDYVASKSEKQEWRKTLAEINSYSLVVGDSYFQIALESIRAIMNSGKRYRNNLLVFYAFIVSKHIYATHITKISYETISEELKIDKHNIAKYIKDLEGLKVLKCSRSISKNRSNCNIYAPYEYRAEIAQYNKQHNRKCVFNAAKKDLSYYRHLSSIATKLMKNPEKWVNYSDSDLVNVYTYAVRRDKRAQKQRDLSVLEQIPAIEKYLLHEECADFFSGCT